MTDTTRRVSINLTIATDQDPQDILRDVLTSVARHGNYDNDLLPLPVESASVHAFDLAEPDLEDLTAQIVIGPHGIAATYINDPESAEESARLHRGVAVDLPVIADHRRLEDWQ